MKFTAAVSSMFLALTLSQAQEYTVKWKKTMMDASRTGVKIASADDVKESMGEMRGNQVLCPEQKGIQERSHTQGCAGDAGCTAGNG